MPRFIFAIICISVISMSCSQMKEANTVKKSYLTDIPVPNAVVFQSVFKDHTWTTRDLGNNKKIIEYTGIVKKDIWKNDEYGSNVLVVYLHDYIDDIIMIDSSGRNIEKDNRYMRTICLHNDTVWSFCWIKDNNTNDYELIQTTAIISDEASQKLAKINTINSKNQ